MAYSRYYLKHIQFEAYPRIKKNSKKFKKEFQGFKNPYLLFFQVKEIYKASFHKIQLLGFLVADGNICTVRLQI